MNVAHIAALVPNLPAQGSVKDVRAYLASLSEGASRNSMRSALDQVTRILTRDETADAFGIPWDQIRYHHMVALRSRLAETYAPSTANKMLAAVRGVLRCAWQGGLWTRTPTPGPLLSSRFVAHGSPPAKRFLPASRNSFDQR